MNLLINTVSVLPGGGVGGYEGAGVVGGGILNPLEQEEEEEAEDGGESDGCGLTC